MLRSLIDTARVQESAGLFIGRQRVGMVELTGNKGGRTVRCLNETELRTPLFMGKPSSEASSGLAAALTDIASGLAQRYLPVHVSLPDAAVRVTVFELEQLPAKHAEQLELARWRLTQEGGASEICACQPLGQEGDKHLLLVLSMDKPWYDCITNALRQAGIVAWSLSANASRQFNRFHDRMAAEGGALVSVTPDAWSLWIWDSHGRPRHARARWVNGDDHVEAIGEIERSILAYVHGGADRRVARVYVAGAAESTFCTALDARLHEPSTTLSVADGIAFEPGISGTGALTAPLLGAALEQ